MTNIVPLNNKTHRDLRVNTGRSTGLGDDRHLEAVIVSEFALLAAHYPLLFAKDGDTGEFVCIAMLGIEQGQNLFLSENDGAADAYRPINMQRLPFYTLGDDIAIDLDHPRVKTSGSEALFDQNGAPTPYLQSIIAAFGELVPGLERTRIFIQTLLALKLIEPVDIKLSFDDGTTHELQDLYTISQDTLRGLPDAVVLDLFRRGYLQLIYTMIASLKQVSVLAQRKNRRILRGAAALGGVLS